MSGKIIGYTVNNIILPPDASFEEAFSVARGKLKKSGFSLSDVTFSIHKKSIDARKKEDIKFVWSVFASTNEQKSSDVLVRYGITPVYHIEPEIVRGNEKATSPVAVIGSGPAGLFAALTLSEAGYPVTLIERGGSISERKQAVLRFEKERILDENTNIQFGAGGAGTFSDGKLVTRVNDPYTSYVLKRLVEFGAPKDILYEAKPHVGTDVLSVVVDRIIEKIKSLGSKILFNTRMREFKDSNGKITAVVTDRGDIECSAVILAVGHSARDTYSMLIERGADIQCKNFSVGMRIEHRAEWIDRGMYGDFATHPAIKHAEYTLSHNTKVRGVYTFCMCPGGVVVPAASETGGVVVNGMSYHARDGINSNSALCCTVFKEDYGATPQDAIAFQRKIERAAFLSGGGDYSAPIITVGDFLSGKLSSEPSEVLPTYMSGGVKLCSPEDYLPRFVTDALRGAIVSFDKKIHGFANCSAVLTGAETRTSAPIRIIRDNDTRIATGYDNLYPSGEGAGYAGGITSASVDGIKTALSVIKRYNFCG